MESNPLFAMIFRGASLTLISRLVFIVLSFGVTSITALYFGPEVVGVVATMTALATLLGIVANAGTSTSINSMLSPPFAAGATTASKLAYRRIITICLVGSGLMAAGLVLLGGGWAERSLSGVAGMSPELVLLFLALAVPLRVLSEITSLAMRTLDHIVGFAILIIMPALASLIVLMVAVAADVGPEAAVWAFCAGLGVAASAGLVWVARRFSAAPADSATMDVPDIPAMLRDSSPMLISTVGAYVVTSSGLLLVSYFATEGDAGLFSVALRLATVTSLVLTSINAITTPIFARLYAAGDMEELVTVARKTSQLMVWAVIPIILGLVMFGRPLLSIAFGPAFDDAYLPMLILLAGQLVNTATGPSDFLMNMTGMQRALRNIIVPAAATAVVLGVALVPIWGVVGAALAYGVSLTCWNVAAAIILRRRFGVWIVYLPLLSRW
nr:polysaccharide biosynthesis protein [Rhizobium sp. TCK]